MHTDSTAKTPTQFIQTALETYAYRRLGSGEAPPLFCMQHFIGTLDNWDPAVIDKLAVGRDVILFDNAGIGRSSGTAPSTVQEMARHALAFLDAMSISRCDVLGYSLGGMVGQVVALERPQLIRRALLVATAPEGGQDIMHMEKPELAKITSDPHLTGLEKLVGLFFASSPTSQKAGREFIARLAMRTSDREPVPGTEVAQAQREAFRAWESRSNGAITRLKEIHQPCLVVNGVLDNMIPVKNSYMLSEHLPNATLLTYPDSGHGSLFQFHESFVEQATSFLDAGLIPEISRVTEQMADRASESAENSNLESEMR